jgi:hypothetical protein
MENKNTERKCKVCERVIKGRSDKKFCDGYCRAAYNNEQKSPDNNFMRNINSRLGKNRRILQQMLPENETMKKTTREKLLQAGFQFKYLTHTLVSPKRSIYYFCYEFGYRPLDNDYFLIVKRNEE